MEISAKTVMALREQTGAPMMDCKRALQEAEGDMEKAKDLLRQRGIAKGQKREGKATGEGTIVVAAAADGSQVVMLELNCETDFVGKSDDFRGLAQALADSALERDITDAEQVGGEDLINDAVTRLGEKIRVGRLLNWRAEAPGVITSYVHTATGRVGVLVELGLAAAPDADGLAAAQAIGRELGMQVTALRPAYLNREEVPAEVVEREREVLRGAADMANKPPQIQDKIIDGRISKFFAENTLLEQAYARDSSKSVTEYLNEAAKAAGLAVTPQRYVRLEVGREDD